MHLDYRERSMRAFQLVLSLEAIIELHLRAIARIAKQHGNAPWKRRQRLKINRAARFTSSDKALYPDFSDRAARRRARNARLSHRTAMSLFLLQVRNCLPARFLLPSVSPLEIMSRNQVDGRAIRLNQRCDGAEARQ